MCVCARVCGTRRGQVSDRASTQSVCLCLCRYACVCVCIGWRTQQSILPSLASTDMHAAKIIFRADKTQIAPYVSKAALKFPRVITYSYVR